MEGGGRAVWACVRRHQGKGTLRTAEHALYVLRAQGKKYAVILYAVRVCVCVCVCVCLPLSPLTTTCRCLCFLPLLLLP